MRRLLLISSGLGLAALAAWAVLELAGGRRPEGAPEIDDSSRARLLEVLEGGQERERRGGAR